MVLTQKSVTDVNSFLKKQYAIIRNKGYKVTIKDTGTWPRSTIHKPKTKQYPLLYLWQIDVSVKPGKRIIHFSINESGSFKSRNYKYDSVDKFKKGFARNMTNRLTKL